MITITGGKLTTYREMAADTVDEVVRELGQTASVRPARVSRSRTKHLHLRGADGYERRVRLLRRRARRCAPARPLRRRGPAVLATRRPGSFSAAAARSWAPLLKAEAIYAARHEMARSLDDVLSRRTARGLLARDAAAAAARSLPPCSPRARLVGDGASRAGRRVPLDHRARASGAPAPRDGTGSRPRRLIT